MGHNKNIKKFSSLLPPPNLTGVLHLGHIWNATIQDFILKWNKLFHNLSDQQISWPLGLDHAGLSLQIKFEKDLKTEGIDFSSWPKEKYATEILEWKNKNAKHIQEQLKLMNFSINYQDEAYTMDDFSVQYSLQTFKQLFEEGLIYQSETLVNWDTNLKTAISDSEVSYQQKNTDLYYIKYYFEKDSGEQDEFIEVATTRPETIFGDVAIFVNPKDERYKKHAKKHVLIPFINKPIPILSDLSIEMDFGTGCMKCSPAHDFLDWELHKKHNLSVIKAFDIDGIISEHGGIFAGLHKNEAKAKLIEHLTKTGHVRAEKYVSNISYSKRSGSIIEPSISKQWFLASSKISKACLNKLNDAIENKTLNIYPKKYLKITHNVLENIHDWCISRQIKWGIQFPIFVHKTTNNVVCSLDGLDNSEYDQIPDRLDTWFTSSLWPMIVFNSSRKSGLSNFFPADLLVSGKDILLFWVAKMIFMSFHVSKMFPFKNVVLHGLVVDKNDKKMSKSIGNGVTPQELLKKYDSDVIKMFFLQNTRDDDNIKYLENKLEIPNRFLQKLKNAFYFFNHNSLLIKQTDYCQESLCWYEQEIWNMFVLIRKDLIKSAENYEFARYSNKFMDFLWDDFCNVFLELVKENCIKCKNSGTQVSENSKKFISYLWEQILLFLCPVIPYFSESKITEIFGDKLHTRHLDVSEKSLKPIKTPNRKWFYKYVKISRQIYHALDINKKDNYSVALIVPETSVRQFKEENLDVLSYYSILKHTVISVSSQKSDKESVCFAIDSAISAEIFLSHELIQKYKNFAQKQIKKYSSEVERSNKILSNPEFLSKANNLVIQAETQKKEKYIKQLNFYKNTLYGQ